MKSRKYIVGVVFAYLILWGPIDESLKLWLVIRIAYIIIIPVLVWFLLKWIWNYWQPSLETEDRLERALAGVTSGVLFVLAIIEATSKYHIGNTMSVQTWHGWEDIGDYIILHEANWGGAFILFIFSIIAFWYSISKRDNVKGN
jgi:hypothetical protein